MPGHHGKEVSVLGGFLLYRRCRGTYGDTLAFRGDGRSPASRRTSLSRPDAAVPTDHSVGVVSHGGRTHRRGHSDPVDAFYTHRSTEEQGNTALTRPLLTQQGGGRTHVRVLPPPSSTAVAAAQLSMAAGSSAASSCSTGIDQSKVSSRSASVPLSPMLIAAPCGISP